MISQESVASIIQQHSGTSLFGEALRRAASPDRLLRVLALYAELNFDFGPCIAALAAHVTFQRSWFVDRSAGAFEDRSYEVAAGIFNAAVDEFGGRSRKHPSTHRNMVQHMVLGATRYYAVEPPVIAEMIRRERSALAPLLGRIAGGYGVGERLDLESTFRAIGFHLGQELCGADEFETLHESMKRDHDELFTYLRENRLSSWITVHLTAEHDHFDQAFASATRAFAYCASEETDVLERRVLEGIEEFARLQADCMRLLASPPAAARSPGVSAQLS